MLSTLELKSTLYLSGVNVHHEKLDIGCRPVIVYVLVRKGEGIEGVRERIEKLRGRGGRKRCYAVVDYLDVGGEGGHEGSVERGREICEGLYGKLKGQIAGLTVGVSNDILVAPAMTVVLTCVEKEDDNEDRFVIVAERDDMVGESGADEETDAVAECEQTGIFLGEKFEDWFGGEEGGGRGEIGEVAEKTASMGADILIAVLFVAVILGKFREDIMKWVFREP